MISIIAAVAKNNVIGKNGEMPWHLPADLRHFHKVTKGKYIVMGRKTYESLANMLKSRGLNRQTLKSGRTSIILSRNPDFEPPKKALHFESIDEVLKFAENGSNYTQKVTECPNKETEKDLFIIGGGKIYEQFMTHADKLYITRIYDSPKGDTFFPEIDGRTWELVSEEYHESLAPNLPAYSFEVYERCNPK